MQSQFQAQKQGTWPATAFIEATGGNATVTCGSFKTHIFTASGPFNVTSTASSAANNTIDYIVVAGGAGGGAEQGGGGGAGGFRMSNGLGLPGPTTSPLACSNFDIIDIKDLLLNK